MANIFDYAGSLRRMGNDHLLFQEMIVLLQEDAPQYLATVHASATGGDYPTLKRAAHTLKGLVLNFGAARAILAAVTLENLAATAEHDAAEQVNLPAAINEFEASLKELQAALADHERDDASARPPPLAPRSSRGANVTNSHSQR